MVYNSKESSASTHICILPSRYNSAYSSGSSIASVFNAQSDPGVVFKLFSASYSQCGAYNRHWYKHQCCFCVDRILQILFSSYLISIFLIISYRVKYRKHFNQFTMLLLLLLYVILCYEIFFPLIFPILRFMKANGRM